jgi:hypothetical protein
VINSISRVAAKICIHPLLIVSNPEELKVSDDSRRLLHRTGDYSQAYHL